MPFASIVAASLRAPEELVSIWTLNMKLSHNQAAFAGRSSTSFLVLL